MHSMHRPLFVFSPFGYVLLACTELKIFKKQAMQEITKIAKSIQSKDFTIDQIISGLRHIYSNYCNNKISLNDNVEGVKRLLNNGADAYIEDDNGHNSIWYAR